MEELDFETCELHVNKNTMHPQKSNGLKLKQL